MTLSKELSVPDSTMESSPPSSIPVKRAAVTYGRHRDTVPILDADSSSSSRHSLIPTGPSDTSEEIPPTSDAEIEDEPSLSDASHPEPKFTFGWKNKLKEIDEADDDDLPAVASISGGFGDASLLLGTRSASPMSFQSKAAPPPNDLFGDPLISTQPPPQSDPSLDGDNSPVGKRRARRPQVVADSDSESVSPAKVIVGSSPESPAFPHLITTPMTHTRTSTPPTSEADQNEDMPSVKHPMNSKGKAKAVQRGVSPLRLFKESRAKASSTKDKGNSKQARRSKVKAPTKKEQRETEFDRARLAADQAVYIEHTEQKKYTTKALFARFQPKESAALPSSPIQDFTSSPAGTSMLGPLSKPIPASPIAPRSDQTPPPTAVVPNLALEDDEELPPVRHLLEGHYAKKQMEERMEQLVETKLRLLAEQPPPRIDDSDDDLEIVDNSMQAVADEEAEQRKAMKVNHVRVSEGRKIQMAHGRGVPQATGKADTLSLAKSKPAFGNAGKGKGGNQHTHESLVWNLRKRVELVNETETRRREEEWVARGGKTIQKTEDEDNANRLEKVYMAYAEKAASGTDSMRMDELGGDEDEDDSDGEWNPEEERGSASPEPNALRGSSSPERGYMSGTETFDEEGQDQDSGEETDDEENHRFRGARRNRAVVDSDDENYDAESMGEVLVPETSFVDEISAIPPLRLRGSISSLGTSEETENENDKENDTRRMWDKSEDKENKAVVRHTLFGPRSTLGRGGSLFGLEEGQDRALSMSPGLVGNDDDQNVGEKSRTPFKELPKCVEDLDPFLSPQITKSTFIQRLASASQPPSPALTPILSSGTPATFSQFYDDYESYGADENDENMFKPEALESGFSQFIGSGAENADSSLKMGRFGSPFSENKLAKLRPSMDLHSLPLTLDVGLAPPLEVNENRKRLADSIFEKEQAYLVEGHIRKPPNEVLYINDHGFLTQTRPDGPNPEVYCISSPSHTQNSPVVSLLGTQRPTEGWGPGTQVSSQSQATQRRPLGTLSLSTDDIEQTPLQEPLRRLKKREALPRTEENLEGGYRSSRSPNPPDAFEVLKRNAEIKALKEKRTLEKSEFIEGEAEESDDDEMRGFGGFGKRKDDGDEEPDGEDLDATLKELVDDKEMNEEEMAEDAVREKHKEQLDEDDKAIEKIAQDAVDGKFRTKRRNRGIEWDDSEDEDEDEEAARIRRKMNKKRKIEGDNLEELGQNAETRAFYNVYQQDLRDENVEFAHLQREGEAMSYDDDMEDEQEMEVVTASEIHNKMRQMARGEVYVDLDPGDVSWVEQEQVDDNDAIGVKEVSFSVRKSSTRQLDGNFDVEHREHTAKDGAEDMRLAAWARTESKAMNKGTGRSAISAAITGHRKPKVKAGGGSLRPNAVASGSSLKTHRRAVKVQSALAKVSDRSGLFE